MTRPPGRNEDRRQRLDFHAPDGKDVTISIHGYWIVRLDHGSLGGVPACRRPARSQRMSGLTQSLVVRASAIALAVAFNGIFRVAARI